MLLQHAFKFMCSPKNSNSDSESDIEILLYGKPPSLVSRAGTVHGGKAGQDGYVLPRDSFLVETLSSEAHHRYL